MTRDIPYNKNLVPYSRNLRLNTTDAERHLWAKLRLRQIKGYRFNRQKIIGNYIVDFFCPKAKLVIEVDGSQHSVGKAAQVDKVRDEFLNKLGLRVLRITDTDVLKNIEGVTEKISESIMDRSKNPP
ncbi:MAG: DUF559 domain-containing protein [Dehalococcoidia bacterium]|nr:MAG: DUF559 domain-containing protein [Dehalococcoidia bacterium]